MLQDVARSSMLYSNLSVKLFVCLADALAPVIEAVS
jgi:hypothetical protein